MICPTRATAAPSARAPRAPRACGARRPGRGRGGPCGCRGCARRRRRTRRAGRRPRPRPSRSRPCLLRRSAAAAWMLVGRAPGGRGPWGSGRGGGRRCGRLRSGVRSSGFCGGRSWRWGGFVLGCLVFTPARASGEVDQYPAPWVCLGVASNSGEVERVGAALCRRDARDEKRAGRSDGDDAVHKRATLYEKLIPFTRTNRQGAERTLPSPPSTSRRIPMAARTNTPSAASITTRLDYKGTPAWCQFPSASGQGSVPRYCIVQTVPELPLSAPRPEARLHEPSTPRPCRAV